MAVPSAFLDELIARSDIVDVVSDYVTLTQKGGSYWGLCPFHGEKTASFHVLQDRQLFHCFGCGKGGGVISFVMEMENLPFIDAVRLLAKRANLEFPEGDMDESARRRRARLLSLNREAARYFYSQLHTPRGREGLEYLQRRGLSGGIMKRFGLGYAPESWDSLILAMAGKGYDKGDLLEAGLAVSNQKGGIYDRFRNRVMFPIIDLRGDVIGFGGRVLGDGAPKYLNSPDTPVFNKSRNLFALNLAKTSGQGRIILTEGYMDTISLYQAGFDCAVASLGTALTPDHARLISRFTKEVVICYDADQAGIQAADRAIPLLEKTGLKVRVLRVNGAKDPDEYIKTYGAAAFGNLLDRSENYISYNLGQLQSRYDLEDPLQKAEFARAAAEMLSGLTSPVEQEVYAGQVSRVSGIGIDSLMQEIRQSRRQKVRVERRKQERRNQTPVAQVQPRTRQLRYDNPRSARAEEGILQLLLVDNGLLRWVLGLDPAQFSSPHLGHIYQVVRDRLAEDRPVHLGTLEGELEQEEAALLAEILRRPVPAEEEKRQAALRDYLSVLENERMKKNDVSDDAAMMAAREKYRKTKGIAGQEDGT